MMPMPRKGAVARLQNAPPGTWVCAGVARGAEERVEVALVDGRVRVRNTTSPEVEVTFSLSAWTSFLVGAAGDEFWLS